MESLFQQRKWEVVSILLDQPLKFLLQIDLDFETARRVFHKQVRSVLKNQFFKFSLVHLQNCTCAAWTNSLWQHMYNEFHYTFIIINYPSAVGKQNGHPYNDRTKGISSPHRGREGMQLQACTVGIKNYMNKFINLFLDIMPSLTVVCYGFLPWTSCLNGLFMENE